MTCVVLPCRATRGFSNPGTLQSLLVHATMPLLRTTPLILRLWCHKGPLNPKSIMCTVNASMPIECFETLLGPRALAGARWQAGAGRGVRGPGAACAAARLVLFR